MKAAFFYQTEIGKIMIMENGTAITNLFYGDQAHSEEATIQETALLKKAGKQLQDYLAGKLKSFTLPLEPEGTEFQKQVWQALQEIPYGETRSYREVAQSIGRPKASRAVGMANSKNPIWIFIPCHRVVGANGKLTGYAGGLDVKEHLLKLEK